MVEQAAEARFDALHCQRPHECSRPVPVLVCGVQCSGTGHLQLQRRCGGQLLCGGGCAEQRACTGVAGLHAVQRRLGCAEGAVTRI